LFVSIICILQGVFVGPHVKVKDGDSGSRRNLSISIEGNLTHYF